jgi:hypothetical protein
VDLFTRKESLFLQHDILLVKSNCDHHLIIFVPCTIISKTTGQLDKSIQYEYADPSGFIKKKYDLTSTDFNLQYAICNMLLHKSALME